jgi:hypothetical protein
MPVREELDSSSTLNSIVLLEDQDISDWVRQTPDRISRRAITLDLLL